MWILEAFGMWKFIQFESYCKHVGDDVTVVDATGKYVMPGRFICPRIYDY